MSSEHDVRPRLTTGDQNLDRVMGGGPFVGSAVVVGGPPGTGKSILAQQLAMANATEDRPAVVVSTLTESTSKLVAHMRGLAFFDAAAIGSRVLLHSSADVMADEGLDGLVDGLSRLAVTQRPSVIVLDSAKALAEQVAAEDMRQAVYELVARLGHTRTTLLLVGEYTLDDMRTRPEFAVADAIVQLRNEVVGSVDRRSLRVAKLRGSAFLSGRHSVAIDRHGLRVFPRLESIVQPADRDASDARCSFGIDGLDAKLGGGLPYGDASLLMGPSGSGKTVMGLHFAADALHRGESVLYVALEEGPDALMAKARAFGFGLSEARSTGAFRLLHAPITELDVDRLADTIRRDLDDRRPSRVVLDSLGELATGAHREGRHPGYLWSLAQLARSTGASVLFTQETAAFGMSSQHDPFSHLFHNVLVLRYLERDDGLSRALMVLKMRDSAFQPGLTEMHIGEDGMQLLERLEGVSGMSGWTSLAV